MPRPIAHHLFTLLLTPLTLALLFISPAAYTADKESIQQSPAMTEQADIWQALRKGEGIALIRHALAPGFSDPPDFTLGDCKTQRNLSDQGREQARAIGQLFQEAEVKNIRLFSSQWCRCQDTARLMDVGELTEQPLLNSFFEEPEVGEAQLAALQEWLLTQPVVANSPLVLLTHQVVITGFTGVYPSSGEIVVIRQPTAEKLDDKPGIEVIGTLETTSTIKQ